MVIIGGSSVFDIKATDDRDWPHLVQNRLRERVGQSVEVINAGVPGHSSFDVLGRMYAEIWTWQPDFVLFYGCWNDIKYFTRLSPDAPLISLYSPYDERADPFRSYRNLLDRLLTYSQLYVKLRTRYFLRKISVGSEGALPEGEPARDFESFGPEQYRLSVELFVDAARHRGIEPMLLTEASLVTEETPKEDLERIVYSYVRMDHKALVRAMRACRQILMDVAREGQVEFLDLDRLLDGQPLYFEDHVHTSERGSERIAGNRCRLPLAMCSPALVSCP